jgi:hypothetical protein
MGAGQIQFPGGQITPAESIKTRRYSKMGSSKFAIHLTLYTLTQSAEEVTSINDNLPSSDDL